MNKHAKIVLWVGLFLITMSIVVNWSVISAVLFSGNVVGGIARHGDTIGNLPTWTNKLPNGKCRPGYLPQSNGRCILHSKLPI